MRFREVVDDNSEDIWDFDKIAISDAKKIEEDFIVGDEVAEEIKIEDFGRRAVILAKQTLIQRVKDLEKEIIISKYDDLIGEIITGEYEKTAVLFFGECSENWAKEKLKLKKQGAAKAIERGAMGGVKDDALTAIMEKRAKIIEKRIKSGK